MGEGAGLGKCRLGSARTHSGTPRLLACVRLWLWLWLLWRWHDLIGRQRPHARVSPDGLQVAAGTRPAPPSLPPPFPRLCPPPSSVATTCHLSSTLLLAAAAQPRRIPRPSPRPHTSCNVPLTPPHAAQPPSVPPALPPPCTAPARRYELPVTDVTLSAVFEAVAAAKDSGLRVLDWGVANATLEEVFIKFARQIGAQTRDA